MFYASFPCGVPIPFWVLFLISDNPGGRNLQISMTSGGQNMKSEHQKTYDLIPHMTHFHGFHILTYRGHWYLEVKTTMIIWGQKGSQNGIRKPKSLWFDTSRDPFTVISYFDLSRGRYWREVKLEIVYMCQYQHMKYRLAKNVKTCLSYLK